MNPEQVLLETWRILSPERQKQVLDFVEFLKIKSTKVRRPRKSLKGLWVNLNLNLTDEEITEAKQEMWGNFPKDIDL